MSAVIEIERTHITSTGPRYRVWHDGEVLLPSSRVPICDAARALVKKGVTGRIQVRRVGSQQIDQSGLIAVLATLTVSEGQTNTPRFTKWSEYTRSEEA